MQYLRILIITLLLFPVQLFADATASPEHGLSKQAMLQRSAIMDEVKYTLDIDLVKSDLAYTGIVKIDFVLSKVPENLRIDFKAGEVEKITINDQYSSDYIYNKQYISLPGHYLKPGSNHLQIAFRHDYAKTAYGFYRFKDPLDDLSYVYTNFEPYDSNKLFPQFDQPDLKATFKLTVLAPEDWTVISNERERFVIDKKKSRLWVFPESSLFSTYLFHLSAGPFKVWESSYQNNNKIIPLRLFSRQSLAKNVDYEEWFSISKKGLEFYEDYFDFAYPFQKYDQIIVPDLYVEAMENVGAVTFSEYYVFQSAPTINQREQRANAIMHELSHMWFGDLVTMRWWNDLWLNESFATMIASLALHEVTEFKDSWQTFYSSEKNWGYWSDQLVTTHPIEVAVNDTAIAFTNFDGITYGKGAAVIKQLLYYLGDDFKAGIRLYFKEHAWSNTDLNDFFNAMQKVSGKDLDGWSDLWIKTAGVNTVTVDYDCKEAVIRKFNLIQKASQEHPFLRPHRSKLALLSSNNDDGVLRVYKVLDTSYAGHVNDINELSGVECPDLVFANFEDQDYVKLEFDAQSLTAVKSSINNIEDTLIRTMIWDALWNMVQDGNWSITEYMDLILKNLSSETNYKIQSELLYHLSTDVVYFLVMDNQDKTGNLQKLKTVEEFLWKNLLSSEPSSDKQSDWYETYSRSISTRTGVKRLEDLLDNKISIAGLQIDQNRRWEILQNLNRYAVPGAWHRVENELLRDNSDYAKKAAIAADVIRPDPVVKKKWMSQLLDFDSKMKFSYQHSALKNIFPREQSHLQEPYVDAYFSHLIKLGDLNDSEFIDNFTLHLMPAFCTEQSLRKISNFVEDHTDLPAAVAKSIRIQNQENARCIKIIQQMQH